MSAVAAFFFACLHDVVRSDDADKSGSNNLKTSAGLVSVKVEMLLGTFLLISIGPIRESQSLNTILTGPIKNNCTPISL